MDNLFEQKGAKFSLDGRYRYLLWRTWGEGALLNFLMLNPSTADANFNDPTVERCERRARVEGFGGLLVTNLFALRSTDPAALRQADDPVGPFNDDEILDAARRSGRVICAWGVHGVLHDRAARVTRLLVEAGIPLWALTLTRDGMPGHPLYFPAAVGEFPWTPAGSGDSGIGMDGSNHYCSHCGSYVPRDYHPAMILHTTTCRFSSPPARVADQEIGVPSGGA